MPRKAGDFFPNGAILVSRIGPRLPRRYYAGARIGLSRLGAISGLGKTLGACALIDELDTDRALIVAPNTAKRAVWEPEIAKFLPEWECVVLRNTKSQRAKDLAYAAQLASSGQRFCLVVHYEALAIELVKLNSLKFNFVIADEVHRISNQKTQMAKSLKKIKTDYKLGLSGSIISNHAEELFSQLQWLYPQTYKSKWRDWNDRYLDFVDGGWGKVCVGVKHDRVADLQAELGVFLTYRRKEDELDLPERTEQELYVDLSASQRKVYDDLRRSFAAQLDDGTVLTAADALSLLTRLRQVSTGLNLVADEIDDSTKIDLAVEMIEDNQDEAFVVFSWYKAAAHALADRLESRGIKTYVVTGDTKHDDRARFIADFQTGERRVFIGTLSTLGESVTLHRANNAIFLDRSWNPGTNAQAADRVYRIGQQNPVTITHIVARNTVDEFRVAPTLKDKEALRSAILGG